MEKERHLMENIIDGDLSGVYYLLENGADPNHMLPEGAAPLHIAAGLDTCQDAMVCLLLEYGANPNIRSSEGETPLHVCATYDKCHVLKLLLLHGANPCVEDEDGKTPLDCAQEIGCDVCVMNMTRVLETAENAQAEETDDEPDVPQTWIPKSMRTNDSRIDPLCTSEEGASSGKQVCPDSVHNSHTGAFVGHLKDTNHQSFETCKESIPIFGRTSLETEAEVDFCKDDVIPDALVSHSESSQNKNQQPISEEDYAFYKSVIQKDNIMTSDVGAEFQSDHITSCLFDSDKAFSVYKWIESVENCRKLNGSKFREGDRMNDELGSSFNTICTQDLEPRDYDPADLSIKLGEWSEECKSGQTTMTTTESLPVGDDTVKQSPASKQSEHQSWFSKLQRFWQYGQKWGKVDAAGNQSLNRDIPHPTRSENSAKLSEDSRFDSLYHAVSEQCRSQTKDEVFQSTVEEVSDGQDEGGESPQLIHSSGMDLSTGLEVFDPRTSSQQVESSLGSLKSLNLSSIPHKLDKYSFNAPTRPVLKERISPGPGNSAQERRTKLRRLSSSSAGTIQYLYTDDEEGYSLIETWFSTKESPSSQSTPGISLMNPSKNNLTPSKPNQNSFRDIDNLSIGITNMAINDTVKDAASDVLSSSSKKGAVNHDGQSLNEGVPEEIRGLSDSMIRNKLIAMGDTPGPIVTTTRKMYEQRLLKIEQDPNSVRGAAESLKYRGHNPSMKRLMVGHLDTSNLQDLEDRMCEQFCMVDPCRRWREGSKKASFNYLLLDPRVTCNLPARVKTIGLKEGFQVFIEAVFYVGKGKRARPYAHFKEAVKITTAQKNKMPSAKVRRILDIWSEGQGVVSLHVFQNVIPVEAYTREAAMIDGLGQSNLTNIKAGEYYGVAASWSKTVKQQLGIRLLHKSFRIFLSEGERHIRPSDLHDA